MKKRIVSKKNKYRHLFVLRQLKPEFKAQNITFGDGYFIFTFGKNTVSHFRINEIHEWQFGMWHHEDGGVTFFGEHDLLIDKFKPSRTYISKVIKDEDDIEELKELLQAIKEDALLHFACSAQLTKFGVLGENDINPHELYSEYIKDLEE